MLPAACFMSDETLRSLLRERPFAIRLASMVDLRRDAADLALSRGDLEAAASLEEASVMAAHRLGLHEDAMLAILRDRHDGFERGQDGDFSI